MEWITGLDSTFTYVYQAGVRYLVPIISILLLLRCCKGLLTFRREPEIWAWLNLKDGRKLPIIHWENIIGSSGRSDVVIRAEGVLRNHCVLTRYDDGSWTVTQVDPRGEVKVNGQCADISALLMEDIIEIGGVEMEFLPITRTQEKSLEKSRTRGSSIFGCLCNAVLLTALQGLICLAYLMNAEPAQMGNISIGFAGLLVFQWALVAFYMIIGKASFELETIAFFLCTMGMTAVCAVKPWEAPKQMIAVFLGIVTYLGVGWSLRDLERAKKVRYLAAVAGLGFLVITLLFGEEYHGAKNWLMIGGVSLQLSEFSKVCFVYVGASVMDRIISKRNLILFIAYTILICACLAVMNDFGTALIFFVAFLLIAYFRSGSIGTVALACTSLGFAGTIAIKIAPHALRRFASWRHIWEYPLDSGYQQTKALMCMAAGGMFGVGAGKGWMENVFAADSDVVIATLGEEWGLAICFLLIACVVILALFTVRTALVARSSFYIIGSCTAAGILLVQTISNALGTVDILPLTGVTFPFVSNGGSSMIGTWGLLAFIKAADTRRRASFAVRQSKEGWVDDE